MVQLSGPSRALDVSFALLFDSSLKRSAKFFVPRGHKRRLVLNVSLSVIPDMVTVAEQTFVRGNVAPVFSAQAFGSFPGRFQGAVRDFRLAGLFVDMGVYRE